MAAVLCSACGDICSETANVCGTVCRAPCTLCGKACNGCCDALGDVCRNMAQFCHSPFSVFVVTAVVFNLPSVYLGVQETMNLECRGSQWLFVNAIFALLHILAALYMARKVNQNQPIDLENPSPRRPSTAFGRAGHLLCYDPIMAIYILILCAFFAWLWTGLSWNISGKASNGCQETVGTNITAALSFGWGFLFCGVGAIALGMCCAYCGVGDDGNSASSVPNYGAAKAAPTTTTHYVNASASKKESSTPPVASVAPTSGKQQANIPTVKATLF